MVIGALLTCDDVRRVRDIRRLRRLVGDRRAPLPLAELADTAHDRHPAPPAESAYPHAWSASPSRSTCDYHRATPSSKRSSPAYAPPHNALTRQNGPSTPRKPAHPRRHSGHQPTPNPQPAHKRSTSQGGDQLICYSRNRGSG